MNCLGLLGWSLYCIVGISTSGSLHLREQINKASPSRQICRRQWLGLAEGTNQVIDRSTGSRFGVEERREQGLKCDEFQATEKTQRPFPRAFRFAVYSHGQQSTQLESSDEKPYYSLKTSTVKGDILVEIRIKLPSFEFRCFRSSPLRISSFPKTSIKKYALTENHK